MRYFEAELKLKIIRDISQRMDVDYPRNLESLIQELEDKLAELKELIKE